MGNAKSKFDLLLQFIQKHTKTDLLYVARGSFWVIAGRGGLLVISTVLLTALANWVPVETYGAYQYVLSVAAVFAVFSLPGINTSLIKSIAQNKDGTLKSALVAKVKWGVIGSIAALVLTLWYVFNQNYILGGSFLVVALFLPVKQGFSVFPAFWIGKKRFDVRAKYMFFSALFSTLTIVATIYLTQNLIVILLAFFASYSFFDFIFFRRTQRRANNNLSDPTAISFGKNLTLINGLEMTSRYLDKIIVWQLVGPAQVAIYSFAQLPIQKVQESIPIQALALPKLGESKIEGKRKEGGMIKFIRLFALTVPTAIILALIAPFVYQIIFPQYLDSVIYFQALTVLIALSPFMLLHSALISELKKRSLYIVQTVAPTIRIVLFLALAPIYGIWGIIWAILSTELLKSAMTLYYFKKI
ncbi:MAG: oligosaccharide flippase family protein [Candidatus Colwellbacteria bacterium]